MKVVSLGALVTVSFAAAAHAAVLINEPFAYDNGPLNGKDPAIGLQWNPHSGTAGQIQVNNGKITLLQSTNTEDTNAGFEGGPVATTANPQFFAGFDLTVPSISGTVADVNFAHFLKDATTFAGRVWMTAPTTSGYRVAVSNGTTLATGSARSADLAFGQTYRVVESYNFTTRVSTLYINPTASSTAITASDTVAAAVAIGSYAFREGTGNTSQIIDNLLVGNTLAEVLVNAPPVVTVTPSSLSVDVSPAGLESFAGVTVSATDDGTIQSLTVNAVPSQIADNVVVSIVGSSATISGTGFTYGDLGSYVLTFTATDNAGATSTGTFSLSVVPEPTTLAALSGGLTLLARRRR